MKLYFVEQCITTCYRWEVKAEDAQCAIDACGTFDTQEAVVIDDWYEGKPLVEEAV